MICMNAFKPGDVITKHDSAHPSSSLVVDGFDKDGTLLAHPLGGGFQISIPADAVARFSAVQGDESISVFSSARFALDGVDGEFQGWCDGELWNGWEKPCFERDVAELILNSVGATFTYSSKEDAFVVVDAEGKETDRIDGTTVQLGDGGSVTAYFVGSGSWIWERVE